MTQTLPIPAFATLPYPVYFRTEHIPADSRYAPHRHAWGQLNYVAHGVMELEVAGQHFLSPPDYGVWIPPEAPHDSYNRYPVLYRSVYFDLALCAQLPAQPHTLSLGPLLKAILADFAERGVTYPQTAADRRLADVLVDQLHAAPLHNSFLPFSREPLLAALLQALQDNPADNRTLQDWASQLHSTERTLARHCRRELGMAFGEWRQRLRFVAALQRLGNGEPVQNIALDLGYSTSSAFISMFQRQAGMSPEQYRRRVLGAG